MNANATLAALHAELRMLLVCLRDRQLAVLLLTFAALFTLAAQAPLHYQIEVGQEDGPGADLPLITSFNTAEHDDHGNYRWTDGSSRVRLPGTGSRPLIMTLRTFPINDEMAARGPQSFDILASGTLAGTAPVRPQGGVYTVLLPAPGPAGDSEIELRSTTVVPGGDVRELGLVVDHIQLVARAGPTLPPLRSGTIWLAALVLGWATIRRIGYSSAAALSLLLAATFALTIAALSDPPRLALGALPALTALSLSLAIGWALCGRQQAVLAIGAALLAGCISIAMLGQRWAGNLALVGLGLVLIGAVRPLIAQTITKLGLPVPQEAWRALCLLAVVVFGLRYGGKIYPDSMPGDIGFHVNRMADTLRGTVFLLSKNRGVFFPYPPALYLLLAPLTLITPDRATILRTSAALLDAVSPMLVFLIAVRGGLVRDWRWGVAAGGVYGLSGAGFMPTWWNFSTHIFAQFGHLLLMTAVVVVFGPKDYKTAEPQNHRTEENKAEEQWNNGTKEPRTKNPEPISDTRQGDKEPVGIPTTNLQSPISNLPIFATLVVSQLLVYFGHFGFWINCALLAGLGLLALLIRVLQKRAGWGDFLQPFAAVAVAQALAALFFYSAYTGLFLEQAQLTASGGFTELAGRGPVDRASLWQGLVEGLYAHIGLLPIPLALAGLLIGRGAGLVRALIGFTLLIGLAFAALPFLTGSTLSTRWLMFSIWAIACASAAAAEHLWRSRSGKIVVVLIGGYVFWLSAAMWVGALAWRVRPPEPF